MGYLIRKAVSDDMPRILDIYAYARSFMAEHGNPHQWGDSHPREEQLWEDIRRGELYVAVSEGCIHGVFAFILGEDPTYARIYDGEWQNAKPYFVIHRVASMAGVHGIMRAVLDYAFTLTDTIRIDTHEDNRTMRALLEKYGFVYCGVIFLENGDSRLAFQKSL